MIRVFIRDHVYVSTHVCMFAGEIVTLIQDRVLAMDADAYGEVTDTAVGDSIYEALVYDTHEHQAYQAQQKT